MVGSFKAFESAALNLSLDTPAFSSPVSISESTDKNTIEFTVKVDSKDMGRVIGREGRIANAIRIVMKSLGNAEKKKVLIHFEG